MALSDWSLISDGVCHFHAQIGSGGTAPPPGTGVKIPTCKFSIKDTFLTSPEELYRVFLKQEVSIVSINTKSALSGNFHIFYNVVMCFVVGAGIYTLSCHR